MFGAPKAPRFDEYEDRRQGFVMTMFGDGRLGASHRARP